MGRVTQFISYINEPTAPQGNDLWNYSHMTITDEIKEARKQYRRNMSTHKNESTGMFEVICDQCKKIIYDKLQERKYNEDPDHWNEQYVCIDCTRDNATNNSQPDMFQLIRPICFWDTETTGTNAAKDRIVSIAVVKIFPDGTKDSRYMLLNPEVPIPQEASDVHGITDDMVAGKPFFRQIAVNLIAFLTGCDLGGYNIDFDIQIMAEEIERYNAYLMGLDQGLRGTKLPLEFPLPGTKKLDSCNIFKKKEERTLKAAVKFYLDEEMDDTHNAQADTEASYRVLMAQVERYNDLQAMSFDELVEYCKFEGPQRIDLKGTFLIDADGEAIFGYGKWKDHKVKTQLGYLDWMINKAEPGIYTQNTLKVARRLREQLRS